MITDKELRAAFLKYLTVDSETQDGRRKEFNQAIFIDPNDKMFGGKQVFNGTDLDMVMEKFDKALKDYSNLFKAVVDKLEALNKDTIVEGHRVLDYVKGWKQLYDLMGE